MKLIALHAQLDPQLMAKLVYPHAVVEQTLLLLMEVVVSVR